MEINPFLDQVVGRLLRDPGPKPGRYLGAPVYLTPGIAILPMQPTNKTPDRSDLWAVLFGLRPFFSSGKWHVRLNSHKQASGMFATGDTPLEAIMNFEKVFNEAQPTAEKPVSGVFTVPIPLDVAPTFFGKPFFGGEPQGLGKQLDERVQTFFGIDPATPGTGGSVFQEMDNTYWQKAQRLFELLKADARLKDVTLGVTVEPRSDRRLLPTIVVTMHAPWYMSNLSLNYIIHDHNRSLENEFILWTGLRIDLTLGKREEIKLPERRSAARQVDFAMSWEIRSLLGQVEGLKECTIDVKTTFCTHPVLHGVTINGPSHFDVYRIKELAEAAIKTIGPVTNFKVDFLRGDQKVEPAPTFFGIDFASAPEKTYTEKCADELKEALDKDIRLSGCLVSVSVQKRHYQADKIELKVVLPYHFDRNKAEEFILAKNRVYAERCNLTLDLTQDTLEDYKLRRRDDTGRPLRKLDLVEINDAFRQVKALRDCGLWISTRKVNRGLLVIYDIHFTTPDHFNPRRIAALASRVLAHEQFEPRTSINVRTRSQQQAIDNNPPTPPVVEPIGKVVDSIEPCKFDLKKQVELDKLAQKIHAEIRQTNELDGRPLRVEIEFAPAKEWHEYHVTVSLDPHVFENNLLVRQFLLGKIKTVLGTKRVRVTRQKFNK